ncbi:MAG: TIGR03560 family F420-dependent LLM class oxidoreductase [Chloroflexi bacterium]|nr:TIGR03560 family F420-dependent LLM class oxidoreductase [Chloroflexota bacterium]
MIEIALMIEGQDGLNWPRWKRIAQAVEDLGFAGLYRSDHFTNPKPPEKDSLELWVSLTWLASHTKRIEFGPMVAPLSFREPTQMVRMASAIDDLSGGRLTLGLGAGWQEREHKSFGFELLDLPERFQRFEDGLEVITRLLNSDEPVSYSGKFYNLEDAILLPRPSRPGGPPILIGGNGPNRTLPLAAKFASEWNAVFQNVKQFKTGNARLDELIEAEGRKPSDVKRSMMTGTEYGRDEAEVEQRIKERFEGKSSVDDIKNYGFIVGTGEQWVEQIGKLEQAGVQRIMLQWMDQDGIDRLEEIANIILPQFKS